MVKGSLCQATGTMCMYLFVMSFFLQNETQLHTIYQCQGYTSLTNDTFQQNKLQSIYHKQFYPSLQVGVPQGRLITGMILRRTNI